MELIKKNLIQFSLAVATVSTIGSLIFSEIFKFPPCVLCWYQRIFMYPLVIIFGVTLWKKDKNVIFFALPMTIIGLIISFYHNLLYYKIIPESAAPCTLGISCTTKFIEWFGFVTIPFLSFISFLSITILLLLYRKYYSKNN
jgi:disulfide bond formation protein DsbB